MTKQIGLTQGYLALVDNKAFEFLGEWEWRQFKTSKTGGFHRIVNGSETKWCNKCGSWKALADFGNKEAASDGLMCDCKLCQAAYQHQYSQTHKEERNRRNRQSYQVNPWEYRARAAKRRAQMPGAPGANYTTPNMIKDRWEVLGAKCWLCSSPAETTDHVKPLSRGGSNWPCNLRPACKHCNSVKGANWPYDFQGHRHREGYEWLVPSRLPTSNLRMGY